MNTARTLRHTAAVWLGMLLIISPAAAQFVQSPPGYHPHAAPYPFANGTPAVDWTAPPVANYDFGGTCCGPHWYDAYVEAVYMTREPANSRALVTDGIPGLGPADVVLSGDDADFEYEPGVRVALRFQLNAVTNIEATYLDALTWNGDATTTSNNHSLFSLYSEFGNTPFGGYEDTDQASFASLSYQSDLDVVEINFRHEWIGQRHRINGAWLVGLRYMKLDERLQFATQVLPHFDPINQVDRDAGMSINNVSAFNEMVGPQIGTYLVSCLMPGLLLEGRIKAGVVLDYAEQSATFQSTTLSPGLNESATDDNLAFVGEAGAQLVVQFHPLWKIRGGYELLFLDGIATGTTNLNGQSPFLGNPRPVGIQMDGQALFHGATLGIEFGW